MEDKLLSKYSLYTFFSMLIWSAERVWKHVHSGCKFIIIIAIAKKEDACSSSGRDMLMHTLYVLI